MPEKLNQEQLLELFTRVRGLLIPFEKEGLAEQNSGVGKYELYSQKPGVFVHDKIRDEVFFVSLLVKSNYVGFYFMPIYTNPEIESLIPQQLLKMLKGKSCFHIKKWDDALPELLESAMRTGLLTYRNSGWL